MSKPKTASLLDYHAAHPVRGISCFVCGLPQIDELNAAKAKGVPLSIMVRWLIEEVGNQGATRNKLHHHFNNRHHEQKK